jgi:hypothetical protein
MAKSDRIDRYLKIMDWLRRRYIERDRRGIPFLTVAIGGKPTIYTCLEAAFFRRYMS